MTDADLTLEPETPERDENTAEMFAAEPPAPPPAVTDDAYVVLARKYRPRRFEDLIGPGGTKVEPMRHSDQAAMYSLDVTVAGDYLTGIDMGECGEKQCDLAVKVYKKKA